jgi:hypothetical protein
MLVLHIGPHKTATTYVQNNLFHARQDLERRGWLYPKIGTEGLPGHHDLAHNDARYIGEGADRAAALSAFAKKARQTGQNIVFSAEGFCRWSPAQFDAFAKVMEADTVDLVHVMRDPFDLFYSHWGEEVKQGHSSSLPDRFAEHFNDPLVSRRLNPMVDLARLSRQDTLRLHAVPYEVLRNRKIDIYTHIGAEVLGLPNLEVSNIKEKNVSFPIEMTEFLRAMTLLHGDGARRLPDNSAMRLRFTRMLRHADRKEITTMMKTAGRSARRKIRIPANPSYLRRLTKTLMRGMEGCWTLPFEEEELFPMAEERTFIYYDTYLMMQTPEIVQAAQGFLDRMTVSEL